MQMPLLKWLGFARGARQGFVPGWLKCPGCGGGKLSEGAGQETVGSLNLICSVCESEP